jgi:probable F420-dependent oxidoreductase
MRKFRFGLQVSKAKDPEAWIKLGEDARDLGYDTISMPDHFDEQFSPLSALSFLAAHVKDITVGTLVLDNDYRHPFVLAREVATLNFLAENRFEFGFGAGWMKSDYIASGLSYDPPKVRVERFKEAVEIFEALFSQNFVNFEGKFYSLKAASIFPRAAKPKLLIGGGSKEILKFASHYADVIGVNASLKAGAIGPEMFGEMLPEKFDARWMWIQHEAGSRLNDIDIQALTFIVKVTKESQDELEKLSALFGIDAGVLSQIPAVLIGDSKSLAETLVERRERWGFNYVVVHEPEMREFSEVIERLKGI